MRRELWEAYAWFMAASRDAAEKLRAGDRDPPFPAGRFPPALPFEVDTLFCRSMGEVHHC